MNLSEANSQLQFWINLMIGDLKKGLEKKYPAGDTRRFFHPKMHGCIEAELSVENDLPDHLAKGIFSTPKTYKAWVRFSNSSPKIKDDYHKDFRGMAIKVLDVQGKFLTEDHENEQDFVLVNKSTFQAKSVEMIARAIRAINGNIIDKLSFAFKYLPDLLKSLGKSQRCASLFEISFFSQTPYSFGGTPVKYKMQARAQTVSALPEKPSYNYLREKLKQDLKAKDYFFDFYIQFQEDPQTMPLENPSVEWTSPFHKVASLKIPMQQFDFEERNVFGEHQDYSPWHCIEEHRPLGEINFAREKVYQQLSRFRLERNSVNKIVETA